MKEDRWILIEPDPFYGYMTDVKPTMEMLSTADFVVRISPTGTTEILKNRWGRIGKVKK